MATSYYQDFLKLWEDWPVDERKRGWDLGAYLWQQVTQAFQEGENTQVPEPKACVQMYESLARLHSNYYKHKYPRPRDMEEYKLILSTDTLEELKEMNKGMWKTLQEKFAPRNTQEKQKAWAQALSCPCI
ncbi:ubiquinol-cytochrome-c reductase complex assembly factor 2-like [Ailuropoda melanoleuca]|uniref:ubiquinol-cytochrome-c reductase complex assembly factor 2-like n=1 Tax=Ailuropoda melanoleuca TaxID=9646 RepID=UPI001494E27F|nr:ubiquinol-cytochrome-c reductase complex assembly factor 2-like [Ailuropoda melanoleuca]